MGFSLADADISRTGWLMDDIMPILIKANDMYRKLLKYEPITHYLLKLIRQMSSFRLPLIGEYQPIK